MNKDFNRWEFIEKWLPNYSSDQDVAWSNDLSKYLAGEYDYQDPYDRDRINAIAEVCPTAEDAKIELERVDCGLFLEALEAYQRQKEKINEC